MSSFVLIRQRSYYLISLIFSVLMLLLSLEYRIELMWIQSNISALHGSIEASACQAELLNVKIENMLDLDELETIAVNKYMMQKPCSDKIFLLNKEDVLSVGESN